MIYVPASLDEAMPPPALAPSTTLPLPPNCKGKGKGQTFLHVNGHCSVGKAAMHTATIFRWGVMCVWHIMSLRAGKAGRCAGVSVCGVRQGHNGSPPPLPSHSSAPSPSSTPPPVEVQAAAQGRQAVGGKGYTGMCGKGERVAGGRQRLPLPPPPPLPSPV